MACKPPTRLLSFFILRLKGSQISLQMNKVLSIFILTVVCSLIVWGQTPCNGKQLFVEKSCAGDSVSADEQALFELIGKYRAANGKPSAKLSNSLSSVANRHLLDLKLNVKTFTHSWSNCPYDIKNEKTWPCIIDAPKRLNSGYNGQGYETLYVTATGKASPQMAIEAWKKSTLHNSIILNLDMFASLSWEEIGVAIDGNYAALWFGTSGSGSLIGNNEAGLGVTYEQAVNGLSKLVPVKLANSTVESNRWQGISADKKIKFEISGAQTELDEAKMAVTAELEEDGKLSPKNSAALSTLLKNIFPEWKDRDDWLQNNLKLVGADHTLTRTKVVRKILVQLRYGAAGSVQLYFSPASAKRAIEVF